MRIMRGLFAGIFALAALGGGLAHAQESARGYWINPALTGEWRDQVATEAQQTQTSAPSEDFALGFTLNGFAGITGSVEMGRVTISPDATDEHISTYGHPGLGGGVDETVGEATVNWNVTDRLQVSTSYGRDEADPTLFTGNNAVFEDEFSGGVTYAITPRFAVSAIGSRQMSADSNAATVENFTGGSAAVNAEYQFMPYFSGSVNYTYQSYDGQSGVLRHDESTLSLSLTGRF